MAKDSANEKDYTRHTSAGKRLLNELAKIDYKKAFEIAERWPGSETVANADEIRKRIQEELKARYLQEQMHNYPERTRDSTTTPVDLTALGYGARADLARSLMLSAEKERAYDIFGISIDQFSHPSPDQRQVQEYTTLLVRLAEIDRQLFERAF